MALQRLDKIVASTGRYTRSEAAALIRKGGVTVNGTPVRSGAEKADPETDEILAEGLRAGGPARRWFMMNKPLGVLSATEDTGGKTVLDLMPPELRKIGLHPAGRLDKDSEGLLLLTNDGDWTHRVISPRRHVWKEYLVEAEGTLTGEDRAAVEAGIALKDFTCLPGRMEILEAGETSRALVWVREGKYRQVRRMLGSLGKPVTSLKRLAVGGLRLDPDLAPGSFRELSEEEAMTVFAAGDPENGGRS